MEITGVEPHEVIFKEVLQRSEFSVVFLVVIRDTTCVMKVVSIWVYFHTVEQFFFSDEVIIVP